MMKIKKYCIVLVLAILFCGCQTDYSKNNDLDLGYVIKQFQDCGFKIKNVKQLILPENLYADMGFILEIDGIEIGVYKFNPNNKKALKTLKRIDSLGVMYIMAMKRKAIINGSFVMINFDQYKIKSKREKIIKAFTSLSMDVVNVKKRK